MIIGGSDFYLWYLFIVILCVAIFKKGIWKSTKNWRIYGLGMDLSCDRSGSSVDETRKWKCMCEVGIDTHFRLFCRPVTPRCEIYQFQVLIQGCEICVRIEYELWMDPRATSNRQNLNSDRVRVICRAPHHQVWIPRKLRVDRYFAFMLIEKHNRTPWEF